MRKAAARRFEITLSAKSVTRFLIASYFMGVGVGVFEGARADILLQPLMPPDSARIFSAVLVAGLALLVMLRREPRIASLLLALVIFWASYRAMMIQAGPQHLAAFWRDLAMIGGLLLASRPSVSGLTIDLMALMAGMRGRLRRLLPATAPHDMPVTDPTIRESANTRQPSSEAHPKRVRSELYRQDFEVARIL